MRHYLTLLLVCQTTFSFSQIWEGDTSLFQFYNTSIQLNDSVENTSSIFMPLAKSYNTSWTFTISLDFSPSSSNRLIVFLASDTNSIEHITKSIYLQLGESGNEDAIELFYLENNNKTLLLRSRNNYSSSIDSLTINVNHTIDGEWELNTKEKSDTSFTSEGNVVFKEQLKTKYFGYSCTYTKTRATLFNLSTPTIIRYEEDSSSPKVNSITYNKENYLSILFSEPIQQDSLKITLNNSTATALLQTSDSEYLLLLEENNDDVNLLITNIIDTENNKGQDTIINIQNQTIRFHELLFTEILYDPNEEQGEFIEIYNPTNSPLDLSKVAIARTTSSSEYEQLIILPKHILVPNSFIALTNYNDWNEPPLNSLNINIPNLINDGATLYLLNSKGKIIDSISYSEKLHSPFLKDTKGISLIKTNEWTSSTTPSPGIRNYTSDLSKNAVSFHPQLLDFNRYPDEQISLLYNFENESSANLFLLDRNGNLKTQLLNTQYIGTEGELFFNLDTISTQLNTGIYILLLEYWDLEGNKKINKNVITIVQH